MHTLWKKSYDQPRQHIKKQRHCFANKGPSSQSYGFSSSHVWMWELDYKESWAPKNWCFWTVVLEKTLESPLDWKEIQQLNPKGNQSWISLGRTDPKAETSILWPPAVKNRLIGCIPFSRESSQSRDWTQISHILYCLSHQWSPRQHIKKQRHRFADEGPSSQSYGFPSSHAQMTAGP